MPPASLHLCTSDAWGGLELYAATLMAELKSAGADVVGVVRPGSKIEEFLRTRDVEVISLPGSAAVDPRSVRFIRSYVRDHHIHVLHAHFHRDIWVASLAARGDPALKLFLSVYMGVTSKRDLLHRFIYRRVDGVFTSSEDLAERLPGLYAMAPSRIHVLPYGRHIGMYRADAAVRSAIRTRHGVKPDEILVGTMVRIDPGKGVMDFARSFSYIDKKLQGRVKYVIVGEPTRKGHVRPDESPFEEHCEAYLREIDAYIAAERLNDRILLVGFQSDLVGYLSAMDLFVFPSRDELYSLVVLDAMGMGLPVIAAAAGGNLRQIDDGVTGLLYPVADSRELAKKISRYIESPALKRKHGSAARRFVETRHDMRTTIARLLEFYETPAT